MDRTVNWTGGGELGSGSGYSRLSDYRLTFKLTIPHATLERVE